MMPRLQRVRPGFTFIELVVVACVLLVLAGILFPVFGQATAKAKAVACEAHLAQIGMGLHLYAQDNGGLLPPSARSLRAAVLGRSGADPSLFFCPSDPLSHAGVPGSYQYVSGLALDLDLSSAVMADWSFCHNEGGYVLYLDGRTRWIRPVNWPVPTASRPLAAGTTLPSGYRPTSLGQFSEPGAGR